MALPLSRYAGRLVHAFSIDGRRGNPAFVFATPAGKQVNIDACVSMAACLQSEVTWIQYGPAPLLISLRFFTPGGEIGFCGHGVLAAAAWIFHEEQVNELYTFNVAGSTVEVERDEFGRWSYLQQEFDSMPVSNIDAEFAEAAYAIGIPNARITHKGGTRLGRSVGALREKLFIEVPDKSYLREMTIDPCQRDSLCKRHGVTGLYAFTVCRNAHPPRIFARHFPIHCGAQEDMATGGIAPTAVRYAGLSLDEGEVVIEQGSPNCDTARLIITKAASGPIRRVAGECSIGSETSIRTFGLFP